MKRIILIAGPSGAGKTTISEYLTKNFDVPRVVTHTTRPMRDGEVPNQSYFFETDETFSKLHFFEHVHYGEYQYGSSREALDQAWVNHDLVSLIVDIKGVRSYLNQLGDKCYFLYVTTKNMTELKHRLIERGDNPEDVEKRLTGSELNQLPADLAPEAHILINDKWDETCKKLAQIVTELSNN